MKAMDLPQRHGEHREDFGQERVHVRGDGKYAQSSEARAANLTQSGTRLPAEI